MAHTCNNTFNRASTINGSYHGFLSPPNFINVAKIFLQNDEEYQLNWKNFTIFSYTEILSVFPYKLVFQASEVISPATSNLAVTGMGQTRLEQKGTYKRKLQGMDHFSWFFVFQCIAFNYSSVDSFRLIMNNICHSIFLYNTHLLKFHHITHINIHTHTIKFSVDICAS